MDLFKKKNTAHKEEIKLLKSLDNKISFTHPEFGPRHQEIFHETKAWYIEALKTLFPNEWKEKIKSFDQKLIALSNDQAAMIHYINETVLKLYIEFTGKKLTKNEWDDKERKEFTGFIDWLIDNSKQMKEKNQIPPGLGGISVKDLPEWYIEWKEKK
jgi:hypothetical protein